ncbi:MULTISPECIES: (2,3-dihydroxybenzoyl)adenylate synthase [Gulosibacter]|uniref:(2,3-dihydroxybenzoyl)adenylate synthase n=1 Tax=Gulosibacter TaxID=256818 RepID=UPI00191878FD|nr:AMP-binding protein [Gulosibacter hominis]
MKAAFEELAPLQLDGVVPYPDELVAKYVAAGYWLDETLAESFDATAERFPHRTAVIDGENQLTYATVYDQSRRLAAGFKAHGIARGDRVVVHLPNNFEYVSTVFALFRIGALPVFALASHRRNELEYFVEFTEATAVVTTARDGVADLRELADQLCATQPSLTHAFIFDRGAEGDDFVRLLQHDPLPLQRHALPTDVAFLQLSGGTTGRPKMIPRTHADYLYSVRESNKICGVSGTTVQLVVLPISHNFTMSSPGILGMFLAGGSIVLSKTGSPDAVFPLVEKHRVTQVALVPPLALAWLNSLELGNYDLSSLRVMQVGGAKLSETVARRIPREFGVTLQQVFGMAEGLVNYTRLDDDPETIYTTQGRPISPADEVQVVDDCDSPVPTGCPGNLLTRGPYTIRGYYKAPVHNLRSFTHDGFYRTGDIVQRDVRGNLTVVGRAKDQINRGGEKIAPEEVENVLLRHRDVHDASVVGVPDEYLGERSKAYVIPRAEATAGGLDAVAVKRFLRQQGMAGYKIPDVVEIVSSFPHTGVGKVNKREQRDS